MMMMVVVTMAAKCESVMMNNAICGCNPRKRGTSVCEAVGVPNETHG
jgi:hypothetical protein